MIRPEAGNYKLSKKLTASIIVITSLLGITIGISSYTFVYAKGYSYMTNDPAACANCHIMTEHYDRWTRSSHKAVAVCNDCHAPAGFIGKYSTKASNGFWHSFAFTTGNFTEPIRIKPTNLKIAEQACLKCHKSIVEAIEGPHKETSDLSCTHCHSGVGHPF
ncbi:MAG: cytochrome c nitrite reductase small subunit [Planctomycetes bacterium]|nr:cytochrome c nitrite reductase small subunit [Planctomycetota bacterium]